MQKPCICSLYLKALKTLLHLPLGAERNTSIVCTRRNNNSERN